MNHKGIIDRFASMKVGDTIIVSEMERPNVYGLARRGFRRVKAKKQKDGSFVVTCIEVLKEKDA